MTEEIKTEPTEAELKAAQLEKDKAEAARRKFCIYSDDGDLLHTSNQEEFDDIVFNICAFGADTRTFEAHNKKMEFTFTTISESINESILKEIQTYIKAESPSQSLLERKSKKLNLCHQLQSVRVGTTLINIRERSLKDRITYFEAMAKQQLDYYGPYVWCFEELVKRALLDGDALGNS